MSNRNAREAILASERGALDRWSRGDPTGYAELGSDDVSYFDDIAAHSRIDGIEAMRDYMSSLKGRIPAHDYEVVNPRVQLYGDVAILTLHYHPSGPDGQPLTRWKATSVYRRTEGSWRLVHGHWSMAKAE